MATGCGRAAEAVRDSGGTIQIAGHISVEELEVGDCFNYLDEGKAGRNRMGVPCAEPHRFELYYQFNLDGDEFSNETITNRSHQGCLAEFEDFVGVSFEQSSLDISALFPSEDTWDKGDREVLCSVSLLRSIDGEVPMQIGSARQSKT